jgi:hypothetical protein
MPRQRKGYRAPGEKTRNLVHTLKKTKTVDKHGYCRGCGERIWFDTDGNGRLVAMNDDLSMHKCGVEQWPNV